MGQTWAGGGEEGCAEEGARKRAMCFEGFLLQFEFLSWWLKCVAPSKH